MLLPTKGIDADRALMSVGADILESLRVPRTVSGTWEHFRGGGLNTGRREAISFDWFTLALSYLYSIGALTMDSGGRLRRHDVH
jgi:hypothetical protein